MKLALEFLMELVYGFFATLGFGFFFNAPINALIPSGLTGAFGWLTSYICTNYFNQKVFGTFLGSFIVGILGEYCAVKYKKPATVFIIPGIIPMVPGAGTYYTMLYLIQKDFYKALTFGAETFFVAAAIALGIVFSSILVDYIKAISNLKETN